MINSLPQRLSAFTKKILGHNQKIPEANVPRSLQVNNIRYSKIFNSVRDALIIIHNDVIIECNDYSLEMFGASSKEDIIGKTPYLLSPKYQPDNILSTKKAKEKIKLAMKGHAQFFEWTHSKLNGDSFIAEVFLDSVDMKDTEMVFAFIRDVSKRKREALIKEVIYDITSASITTSNLFNLVEYIRTSLSRIIDTTNFYVALHNKTNNSFYLPYMIDDKDHFESFPVPKTLSGYVFKTKKSLLANKLIMEDLEKKGEIDLVGSKCKIWLGVPLTDENEVIGILGVQSYINENAFTDNDKEVLEFVSGQISMAITKKRFEDALKIEKAYFEQLFKHSPEGVVITNSSGHIIRANNSFCNMFQYELDEIINKNLTHLISPAYLVDEANQLTVQMFQGKVVKTDTIRIKRDGSTIDVSILGAPIILEGGIVAGYSIYRDIIEHKVEEQRLRLAKEKAEESDKLKTAFLANMSHEIRTPMNAIIGFSDLLITEDDLDNETKSEYLTIIKSSGSMLLNLIDDIIDIAKIETGQVVIKKDICYINEMLTELYISFENELRNYQNNDVALTYFLGNKNSDFAIITDRLRLKQILFNLLSNAIKFTHEGSINFGYELEGDYLQFYVKDTGIGLNKDKLEIIFDRFTQVHNQSPKLTAKGTGLGLSISKNLTELMGGSMWVNSTPGKGSEFYFTLPNEEVRNPF